MINDALKLTIDQTFPPPAGLQTETTEIGSLNQALMKSLDIKEKV